MQNQNITYSILSSKTATFISFIHSICSFNKILVILCVFISDISLAQEISTQTIRGIIVDNETEFPLIGATIQLVSGSSSIIGAMTDQNGQFVLEKVPIGRQSFVCEYLGYKDQTINNVLILKGKEGNLYIRMTESVNNLSEIVITNRRAGETINPSTLLSASTLEKEEIIRFSGTMGDISRMAQNFAGVSGASDDRNDIIVRGNSPSSVLWRMEGVDIPSPNHWATLGTTGGPISMLNTNNLRTSDFISGAFPAEYANATGAVFDLKLRNGNSHKYEYLGQIGFNGFEAGIEGPIKGIGKNASFLVNYRYSTLALIKAVGFDIGTGSAVPKYQDINFKVNMPTENAGQFSIWGLGGISDISFMADDDSNNLFSTNGENLMSGTNTGILGFNHRYFFNKNTSSTVSLALSSTQNHNVREKVIQPNSSQFDKIFDGSSTQTKTTINWVINKKINTKNSVKLGANYDLLSIKLLDSTLVDNTFWFNRADFNGNTSLFRLFGQWQYKYQDKLKVNIGLNGMFLGLSNSYAIEPRLGLAYNLDSKNTVAVGYGRHNQMQPLPVYFSEKHDATPKQNEQNKSLDFLKSDHFILSYTHAFNNSLRLKLEGYYQNLFSIAVDPNEGSFSALNIGADFVFPNNVGLVNDGTGSNKGIELTFQQNLKEGFYYLLTGSIFDSQYAGSDGIERDTYYNSNFVTNLLVGKEFSIKENLLLTLNSKFTYAGGRRYTPIDLQASIDNKRQTLDYDRSFESQYDPYIRPDIKIGLKANIGRTSHSWSIDFQNFIGRQNIFSRTYNESTQTIETLYQRGFWMDIRYQIVF